MINKANVDTSTFVEPPSQWIRALETRVRWQLWIKTKEFEIMKIGVEEGVDIGSGIKDSLLLNMV